MTKNWTAVVLLIMCSAGSAAAQPVSDLAFKCQTGTSKAAVKFLGAQAKCVLRCQKAARKGLAPFSTCSPPYGGAMASCITDSLKGVEIKAIQKILKGCTGPGRECPACYSDGDCGNDAIGKVLDLEVLFYGVPPAVFCAETSDREQAKCMDGTAKAFVKQIAGDTKCFDKCRAAERDGATDGDCAVPAPTDSSTVACLQSVLDKAVAAFGKACFVPPAEAPSCYNGISNGNPIPSSPTAGEWGANAALLVSDYLPPIYCGPTTTVTTTSTSSTTTLPCEAIIGGFCWYKGAFDASCDATCAANGKIYDEATRTYAGSDGTDAHCGSVLSALGMASFVSAGALNGVGCFEGATSPPFTSGGRDTTLTTASASRSDARRACACEPEEPSEPTRCCHGTMITLDVCFDSDPATAAARCAAIGGTLGASGTFCDGAGGGGCEAAKSFFGCCQTPTGRCFESGSGLLTPVCTLQSGTIFTSATCGPQTHTCTGP